MCLIVARLLLCFPLKISTLELRTCPAPGCVSLHRKARNRAVRLRAYPSVSLFDYRESQARELFSR